MNNLDKKIALVLEIQELSIWITNNSKTDVFVDYSGHVNGLSIRIMLNGWKQEYTEPDYSKTLYLDRNSVKEFQETIDHLKAIKEEI